MMSFRITDPGDLTEKNGWKVAMRGLAEISIEQSESDPRKFGIAMRMTDNAVILKTLRMPVPLDRGTYKQDVKYEQGDWVTWDGIVWRALVDTNGEPGVSKDWGIAVRKGRDGKDGAPGKQGEPGKQGPIGRPGLDRV